MAPLKLATARPRPGFGKSAGQARKGSKVVCRAVAVSNNGNAVEPPSNDRSSTQFVAETLLPTAKGKFRLRGYRHTVRDSVYYQRVGMCCFVCTILQSSGSTSLRTVHI